MKYKYTGKLDILILIGNHLQKVKEGEVVESKQLPSSEFICITPPSLPKSSYRTPGNF